MSNDTLPLVLEAEALKDLLGGTGILVVDLARPDVYRQYHVPGAVHLDYPLILGGEKPAIGQLPDTQRLARVLGGLGITPETHVVACDEEGGGKAARLLWTLECMGHRRHSLLNGGLIAWANDGHPLEKQPTEPEPAGDYPVSPNALVIADRDYVEQSLANDDVRLLDARSPQEYAGQKVFAARGGHIPGAVNLDWTETMDRDRHMRLLPATQLRKLLEQRGLTPDHEIVVYCQTHHRSALSYIMLKSLGYERVRGYAGSWSEWGNLADTPIET